MHVDVDTQGRHVEPQEDDRLPTGQQPSPIPLLDGMQNGPVPEGSRADQEVLQPATGQVVLWPADEGRHRHIAIGLSRLQQPVGQLPAEQVGDPLPPACRRDELMDLATIMRERKADFWMGQCRPHERLRGVRPLGRRRPEKGPAGRNPAEELMDLDARAAAAALRGNPTRHAPIDLQAAARAGLRATAEHQPRDLGNRSEGLPAKAEGGDLVEVFGNPQLAGGVRLHRQRQVLRFDAAAVVNHPHQGDAALFDGDVNLLGPGVECILQQLFDDTRRPLDHLAGCNPIDDRGRQCLNPFHVP